MSAATTGSNGVQYNLNPTGQPTSFNGGPATGLSRGEAINPPDYNRPLATPAIFAQSAALRAANPAYKGEPR